MQFLEGITVADFSRVLAGPLCTQMLAEHGARVLKIEEPLRGDETRHWGPPFVKGVSTYFLSVNRGKESVALDLKSRRGLAVAKDLIRRADIVVDNFLPQQRASLGLANISRINRNAIHLSISGFDPGTPDELVPGYDLLAQAGGGLMAITGEPDGNPMKVGVALSDVLTAHHAFGAIVTALFARERTGRGARLEVSLFGSTLASLVNVAQSALLTGKEARRFGNEHASIVPYQLFSAKDRPFAIGAGTDRHFAALCNDVIGQPDLATDPHFSTNAARVANRGTLVPLLSRIFGERRAEHWLRRMRKAGIPCSAVAGPLEALRAASAGDLVATSDHPTVGRYEFAGYPVIANAKRIRNAAAPPLLGQHTAAVLRELGYESKKVTDLLSTGAAGSTSHE